jgi:hypothetical protein
MVSGIVAQRMRVLMMLLMIVSLALGHDLPVQLPEPQSVGESWNVLEQIAANVDELLRANLLRDIAFQIANTSRPAIYLSEHAGDDAAKVQPMTEELLKRAAAVIVASRDSDPRAKTRAAWLAYRETLKQLEAMYPPDVVKSDVYVCPMHPLDRHLNPNDKCSVCGMSLIRRHLPASSVYQKPGEATLKMSVESLPLVVGKAATVKVRVSKPDGSPVLLSDLVEMHTKKIHLLINDRSLSDYHHEHPTPTQTPGEYEFHFTPSRPGPYRVWADVVPAATSVQEYVIADIPAGSTAEPLVKSESTFSATVNGRTYALNLNAGKPVHAGETAIGVVTIANSDGKPCTALEPVMGAFAHVVGFSEDGTTVLHIHPYGKEPKGEEERAGPAFAFKFYAPTAGFLRLYVQVQIGGKQQFAPFAMTVLPAH